HAALERRADLTGQLTDPFGPSDTDMAGLGDEHRQPVAFIGVSEQCAERDPSWIARVNVPVNLLAAGMLPLVVVVEVDADDVEIFRMAAQLRRPDAGEH